MSDHIEHPCPRCGSLLCRETCADEPEVEIEALQAENSRLRAEIARLRAELDEQCEQAEAAEREVEWLTNERKAFAKQIERAEAAEREVERLKGSPSISVVCPVCETKSHATPSWAATVAGARERAEAAERERDEARRETEATWRRLDKLLTEMGAKLDAALRERDEAIKAAQKANADEERAQENLDAERALADRLAEALMIAVNHHGPGVAVHSEECPQDADCDCTEPQEINEALAEHAAARKGQAITTNYSSSDATDWREIARGLAEAFQRLARRHDESADGDWGPTNMEIVRAALAAYDAARKGDCLGCKGGSVHHTCGREPDAEKGSLTSAAA